MRHTANRRMLAIVGGAATMLSIAAGAQPADAAQPAKAEHCAPKVIDQGKVWAMSHNGARIFARTVTIRNSNCSDTSWRLDIRPMTFDRNVTLKANGDTHVPISSGKTIPYVHAVKPR